MAGNNGRILVYCVYLLFCVDAEDALNMVAPDTSLYYMNRAQRPKQLHYFPSAHHKHPAEWINLVYTAVQGQFADAEE